MTDWSLLQREWLTVPPPSPYDPFQFAEERRYFRKKVPPPQAHYSAPSTTVKVVMSLNPPPPPSLSPVIQVPDTQQVSPSELQLMPPPPVPPAPVQPQQPAPARGDSPRQMRNRAEKQRRDKLNKSIADLAAMVPPVLASGRKIDKTGVLRLTAHYLRAHQYVFGDSIGRGSELSESSTNAVLSLLNGFLITMTYRGLIVVVSPNITDYLGYSELELLGQNISSYTHIDDYQVLMEQLMPRTALIGPNGRLLAPEKIDGTQKLADSLAKEKRSFVIRFKKHQAQRSDPIQYVSCHVEGSLRKSDRACAAISQYCQMIRRARARGENPCSSGNDVVFIGMVRPVKDTFIKERVIETFNMEYKTRHSVDGEILQCEQRISLITGYMINEVYGVNAMNFIHRDEVSWVIEALQDMYNQCNQFGESCYRLMTKNGQFIYLRTRGELEVDKESNVKTFTCMNTVVDEQQGKELIKMMKEKLHLNRYVKGITSARIEEVSDNHVVAVEDPRQLEKQILELMTNLPSPQMKDGHSKLSPDRGEFRRFSIIPPKKERIVSAIEKIYEVFKTLPKQQTTLQNEITSLNTTAPYSDQYNKQSCSETDLVSSFETSDFQYVAHIADAARLNTNAAPQYHQDYKNNMESQRYVPDCSMPSTSTSTCTGTKRQIKFDESQENFSKKKVMEVVQNPVTKAVKTMPKQPSILQDEITPLSITAPYSERNKQRCSEKNLTLSFGAPNFKYIADTGDVACFNISDAPQYYKVYEYKEKNQHYTSDYSGPSAETKLNKSYDDKEIISKKEDMEVVPTPAKNTDGFPSFGKFYNTAYYSLPGPSIETQRPNTLNADKNNISQQKVMDVAQDQVTQNITTDGVPPLEMFFEEGLLNHEIESALSSLDEDSPNTLIPQELQEFLDDFEP